MLSSDTTTEPVEATQAPKKLPFPPVTRTQILHCSYHYWHPLYRAITPKARLIPLSDAFLSYLRADGIVLPPDNPSRAAMMGDDSGIETSDSEDDGDQEDPSEEWSDIHIQIEETIRELDGKVTPKLNWSAPKDATWIAVTNDLQCQTPNDIYLLLKSSDFITHDLEHVFDDTDPEPEDSVSTTEDLDTTNIPYYLVLRKYFNLNPSLEFRCFVRNRTLLCMCQRDLNHFDFLFAMRDMLVSRIQTFFDEKLKDTFPEPNFVFDVYVPPPHERVWLIDINPWALRTDPLLFSWLEILTMKDLAPLEDEVVRLSLRDDGCSASPDNDSAAAAEEIENISSVPELRLVERDDPEAYGFTSPQYSAHKLPRDVVDASQSGTGGMASFMQQWKDLLAQERQQQQAESSDDE
ncbi:cell cycle control protein Cdc123 [Talaromyces stipitatus ATCC 10500]|uniref:Cell cycle control protein Cdc123 n=1 Tax=Talaromyces stipitatus (strain ATCC 10500 / CBS 375.48 / QM 6759 / NRRL 1006) TaxID=441959 RepID=B8M6D3_TALSN|nr:cell cycle control protein Cdc123 [Talaromyces stipitatus ATCC 10500]EED19308.1 cell cycle control protein Cdc123 [Talaromyces stipitatus ATCC 10500]